MKQNSSMPEWKKKQCDVNIGKGVTIIPWIENFGYESTYRNKYTKRKEWKHKQEGIQTNKESKNYHLKNNTHTKECTLNE